MADAWGLAITFVEQIKEKHFLALSGAKIAIARSIECGQLLKETQEHLAHREWKRFVDANLPFGVRQAQRHMKAASLADRGAKPKTMAAIAVYPMLDTVNQQEADAIQASEDFREQMTQELDDSELPDETYAVSDEEAAEGLEDSLEVKFARHQYPSDWDDDIDGCPEMTDATVVALNQGRFMGDCIREANRMRNHLVKHKDETGLAYLNFQQVIALLKDFARAMKDAIPRCPCPLCQQRGCDFCTPRGGGSEIETKTFSKPLGWIDHWHWKQHVKVRNIAKKQEAADASEG